MLRKIISGGQTGADRGGLEAGRALGLETGGWAPRGYLTDNGPDPSLKDFGLLEHRSPLYPPRTYANAKDSDGTVWFGGVSAGFRCTLEGCHRAGKPFLENPTQSELRDWLQLNCIRILNVAGNRESRSPGIRGRVKKFLVEALHKKEKS